MLATTETLEMIRGYYGLLDAGRFEECERYFTPDATLRVAHHPEVAGRDAIIAVIKAGLTSPVVKGITHEVKAAWEEDNNTVIFDVAAIYAMSDGRSITVPGIVVAEVENGCFCSQRIAADLSPIFAS